MQTILNNTKLTAHVFQFVATNHNYKKQDTAQNETSVLWQIAMDKT